MSNQTTSFHKCTGGGYIIRAATGKKDDFVISKEQPQEEKPQEEKPKEPDK